jgi:hypothetical protein
MLVTTERPTARQVTARAWQSLFSALRRMAPFFLTAFLLLVAVSFVINQLSHLLPFTPTDYARHLVKPGPVPLGGMLLLLAFTTVSTILSAIILAPVAVAIHRFILLGETRTGLYTVTAISLRFAAWVALFRVTMQLFQMLQFLRPGSYFLVSLINLGYWVLVLWTLLLFPAVAVEEYSDGAAKRLDIALERTKGNFWLTLRAMLLTLAPLVLVMSLIVVVPMFKGGLNATRDPAADVARFGTWPYLLWGGVSTIALVALGAAAASWLYSYALSRTAPQTPHSDSAS